MKKTNEPDNPIDLEKRLLDPATRNNRNKLDLLLSSDFFEYGYSGKIWNREEIIDALVSSLSTPIEGNNFEIRKIAENIALVTFRTKGKAPEEYVLRSSIWRKDKHSWKLVFHQATASNVSNQ